VNLRDVVRLFRAIEEAQLRAALLLDFQAARPTKSGFSDFEELVIRQSGTSTIIDLGVGSSITLENVDVTTLPADEFRFV
jgi:hypothetical protein